MRDGKPMVLKKKNKTNQKEKKKEIKTHAENYEYPKSDGAAT